MIGQLPSGSGSSNPSHRSVVDPLRPGVTELQADLRLGMAVDIIRDPLPAGDMVVAVDPRAAGADPPLAADIGHFRNDQTRAAHRAAAEMDEVPVVGHAVLGGILAHG